METKLAIGIIAIAVVVALSVSLATVIFSSKGVYKDLNKCTIISSAPNPEGITCNKICYDSGKICILSLKRFSEYNYDNGERNSQEFLTDCRYSTPTGNFNDDGNLITDFSNINSGIVEDSNLNCVCC